MVRVAVLVSGGGTNLQAILDAKAAGKIPHGDIALVVSNKPEAIALERAARANIPTAVVKKEKGMDPSDYGQRLLDVLKTHAVEFVVLAGFLVVLPENVIRAYENRIINVHPSLIPAFCGKGFYGLKVHEAALNYGVKVTGATVHYVNEIPDGGKIIAQKAVEILPEDTAETLQKRVMIEAEWLLLPKALEFCCRELAMVKETKKSVELV